MGIDRHHAIVVTGFRPDIEQARAAALRIIDMPDLEDGPWEVVSPIMLSPSNGWLSFVVIPDGGKEGWERSREGDSRRAGFVAYLKSLEGEHAWSPLAWVEVQYGDHNWDTRIGNDSDAARRALDKE